MSDSAPHAEALESRYLADLAALREQAKTAGDRIVTGVEELRVLTPPPHPVPQRTAAPESDDLLMAAPAVAGVENFDLDAPLAGETIAMDDDGIPMWSDPE